MPFDHTAGVAAGIILTGFVVFQLFLIGGAPLGRLAWGGQHRVLPRGLRISSAVSIVLYAGFGYAALARAGLVAAFVDDAVLGAITWVLTAYFALGVVLYEYA